MGGRRYILKIQKFKRIVVSYAGFFFFSAVTSYAHNSHRWRGLFFQSCYISLILYHWCILPHMMQYMIQLKFLESYHIFGTLIES